MYPSPHELGSKTEEGSVKKCGSGVAHRTTILNNGYVFSKSFYIGEGVKIHQNNVHVICTWPHRSEKSIQKADGCIIKQQKTDDFRAFLISVPMCEVSILVSLKIFPSYLVGRDRVIIVWWCVGDLRGGSTQLVFCPGANHLISWPASSAEMMEPHTATTIHSQFLWHSHDWKFLEIALWWILWAAAAVHSHLDLWG